MIRAVIDTNVLVSGLLSPAGNEALIVLAIHQGFVRPCLSEPIIAEYAAVLARPKFAFQPEEIEAVLAMLQGKGEIFRPEESGVPGCLSRSSGHQVSALRPGSKGGFHRHRQQAGLSRWTLRPYPRCERR